MTVIPEPSETGESIYAPVRLLSNAIVARSTWNRPIRVILFESQYAFVYIYICLCPEDNEFVYYITYPRNNETWILRKNEFEIEVVSHASFSRPTPKRAQHRYSHVLAEKLR